jgi:hypothetical protein
MSRSVFFFGNGHADGTREMKTVLGGKGANLAEMTNIGVPVPPGFTIAAAACMEFLSTHSRPPALEAEVAENLARLEAATGRRLGDALNPLLVSVRSGAAVSMPGMMETILNLGLNDRSVIGLARQSGNARFAYDSYRRFLQMYGDVVLGVPIHDFENLLKAKRITTSAETDAQLTEDALRNLVEEYKTLVRHKTGAPFPMNPQEQLWGAIEAVWNSWTLKKAVDYRRVNGISETLGTGVNIVAMVFGNMGDDSGTGVAFTRNPSTGERAFYGEFLVNAQGEDVVAGIDAIATRDAGPLPDAYRESRVQELETHFREIRDLEFTVEQEPEPAADATGSARPRLRSCRSRYGRRRAHRKARRSMSTPISSTSYAPGRSVGACDSHRDRTPGEPRCGRGAGGVRPRCGGDARRPRRLGDPGARGDNARRFSRHRCVTGRAHLPRWDDEPRSGCRSGDGEVCRCWLQRVGGIGRKTFVQRQRHGGERGRLDHARWCHGAGVRRGPPDGAERGGARHQRTAFCRARAALRGVFAGAWLGR